jgi:SAM-dependent methyltransferase
MKQKTTVGRTQHGNRQKHLNPNKLQQALIIRFHQVVARLVMETGAERLLDVGCGEGFALQGLRQAGVRAACIGFDIRFDALQWGRNYLLLGLPVNVADIHHLPLADNAFPVVLCLEVLEHIPDSTAGLRELARVSSDYLILSVPHEPFFRGVNFLRGKHLSRLGNDPEHLHNYNGRSFQKIVSHVADIVWHGYAFPWQIILAKKLHSS